MKAFSLSRGAAIAFIGTAGSFLYEATRYPYRDETGPGAGFFPVWIGILGLAVGIGLLLSRPVPAEMDAPLPGSGRVVAFTVAALVLAALGLEPLGFRFTTLLLVGFLMRLFGSSWIETILMALGASVLVFSVFGALQVRLPVGVFGF